MRASRSWDTCSTKNQTCTGTFGRTCVCTRLTQHCGKRHIFTEAKIFSGGALAAVWWSTSVAYLSSGARAGRGVSRPKK